MERDVKLFKFFANLALRDCIFSLPKQRNAISKRQPKQDRKKMDVEVEIIIPNCFFGRVLALVGLKEVLRFEGKPMNPIKLKGTRMIITHKNLKTLTTPFLLWLTRGDQKHS